MCLLTSTVSEIGEEINASQGKEFVKSYQNQNQNGVESYVIGKNILQKILNQPCCDGIKFYNAINEYGQETLVYIGLDEDGKEFGIVADRSFIPRPKGIDSDDFEWIVD